MKIYLLAFVATIFSSSFVLAQHTETQNQEVLCRLETDKGYLITFKFNTKQIKGRCIFNNHFSISFEMKTHHPLLPLQPIIKLAPHTFSGETFPPIYQELLFLESVNEIFRPTSKSGRNAFTEFPVRKDYQTGYKFAYVERTEDESHVWLENLTLRCQLFDATEEYIPPEMGCATFVE